MIEKHLLRPVSFSAQVSPENIDKNEAHSLSKTCYLFRISNFNTHIIYHQTTHPVSRKISKLWREFIPECPEGSYSKYYRNHHVIRLAHRKNLSSIDLGVSGFAPKSSYFLTYIQRIDNKCTVLAAIVLIQFAKIPQPAEVQDDVILELNYFQTTYYWSNPQRAICMA